MKKISRVLLFFNFALCFGNSAVSLNVIDRHDFSINSNFDKTLKEIYIKAFSKVYKAHWVSAFEKKMEQNYTSMLEKFKSMPEMFLITISVNDTIAGWALFEVEDTRALLRAICVDPSFQKKHLGKQLVFSIKTPCPKIKTILVFTFVINTQSPLFYQSIGFVKTAVMLPEYAKSSMQGFEYTFNS